MPRYDAVHRQKRSSWSLISFSVFSDIFFSNALQKPHEFKFVSKVHFNGFFHVVSFFMYSLCHRHDAEVWPSVVWSSRSHKTRKWKRRGIINLLFVALTHNTSRHFAHWSYFPCSDGARKYALQLAKYARVLYDRPLNELYLCFPLSMELRKIHEHAPFPPFKNMGTVMIPLLLKKLVMKFTGA